MSLVGTETDGDPCVGRGEQACHHWRSSKQNPSETWL